MLICLVSCPSAFGLGQDQLYTGTAATVPPGLRQFQFYYSTTFSSSARLSGTSLAFGATSNSDVKFSYGFLWTNPGPNVQLGPTIGAKWRFMGDGLRKPSMSVSGLFAINSDIDGRARKNDAGGLLVVQYPTPSVTFLGNFGRVWVGDNIPDLRYTALALARPVTPRVLLAAEYVDVTPIGDGPPGRQLTQYIGAIVYHVKEQFGYSLQIGYGPRARNSHWNTTVGYSRYF
jgi:hypothetical protein